MVAASDEPWAALGAASAARIYGCVVLREGVEDEPGQRHPLRLDRPGGNRARR